MPTPPYDSARQPSRTATPWAMERGPAAGVRSTASMASLVRQKAASSACCSPRARVASACALASSYVQPSVEHSAPAYTVIGEACSVVGRQNSFCAGAPGDSSPGDSSASQGSGQSRTGQQPRAIHSTPLSSWIRSSVTSVMVVHEAPRMPCGSGVPGMASTYLRSPAGMAHLQGSSGAVPGPRQVHGPGTTVGEVGQAMGQARTV